MTNRDIFINSDMGEGLGLHSFGNDEQLMEIVDVANLACGFHAGDPQIMAGTVRKAMAAGVKVGSHPGLPDLVGFGRRRMALTADEVENLITYQTGALRAFLDAAGGSLNHIKPHGALWGMLADDDELMRGAARAVKRFGVPFFGLSGTAHQRVCEAEGIEFVREMYVDMNYNGDGSLALVRVAHQTDPQAAADRVRKALAGEPIEAVDGSQITLEFDSVCVHSDSRNAVDVARAVRAVLNATH